MSEKDRGPVEGSRQYRESRLVTGFSTTGADSADQENLLLPACFPQ
jgi:hypothetical protein